jgi:hypothetical protein
LFLDSWLALATFGPISILAVLFLLLASGIAFVSGIQLRKKGRVMFPWLLTLPAAMLLVSIAAVSIYILSDHRSHKQVVLDLRVSQSAMLMSLISSCTSKPTDGHCDSTRYVFDALVIFPDGLRLSIAASSIHWSLGSDQKFKYISLMDTTSLSLQSSRRLLLDHAAAFSGKASTEKKKKIEAVGEWLLDCCKNNAVYSEVNSINLTSNLELEFRKNIDQVWVAYSITPDP